MSGNKYQIQIKSTGVAAVLLKKVNNEYKVLLLKRAASVLKDVWCYIGGSIEKDEKAWESALREVKEETGITNVLLYTANKFDQIYSPQEDYIYIAPVFVGFVEDNQEVILNDEHSDFKWLSFSEAIAAVTLPGNDEVLMSIEKHFVHRDPPEFLLINNKK
jgi:dihydroneopterin triphosphate diphosphatase